VVPEAGSRAVRALWTANIPDDDSLFRPGHDVALEGDATVPEERLGFRALAHAVPAGTREGGVLSFLVLE
jgi:hypothetical protein